MKWEFCTKDAYKNISSDDKAFEYEEQLIKKNSTRK
jgi:hypothetical protein